MTLRLSVQRQAWSDNVGAVAAQYPVPVIAVVKGNGYGFGRQRLASIAAGLLPAAELAVGTAAELAEVGGADGLDGRRVHVLVPIRSALDTDLLDAARQLDVVATVGDLDGAALLAGHGRAATVKLRSSMQRYGVTPDAVGDVVARLAAAGCEVDGLALHLPLAGTDAERVAEVDRWLATLEALASDGGGIGSGSGTGTGTGLALTRRLSLSHLGAETVGALAGRWPGWELRLRLGTRLWHGDKAALHLGADVVAVHPLAAGDTAGYHRTPAPSDGHLVVVGVGSAHGVAALDDGRSPFHHRRRRLALFERPHMHSTLVFVGADDPEPVPAVGETVDVQRPLIAITADEIRWT